MKESWPRAPWRAGIRRDGAGRSGIWYAFMTQDIDVASL